MAAENAAGRWETDDDARGFNEAAANGRGKRKTCRCNRPKRQRLQ